MFKKIFCTILLILITSSYAASEINKTQFVVGQESEFERLNPITLKNPQTYRLAWNIFEGLVGLNEEGEVIPMIAENWESSDNKIWTFHIRKDVTFHGSEIFRSKARPVTAHDVHYSYTRFCSSEAYWAWLFIDSVKGCAEYNSGKSDKVEGFTVIDDYTFQIELIKPEPFFINRISSPTISIFPKEADYEKNKNKWGIDIAVGTGPFVLFSKNDNEVVLHKNENYWDKQRIPQIDKLVYRVIKNDQLRFTELIRNKIDLMVLPTQLFPTVFDSKGKLQEKYKNFRLKEIETFNTHLIGVNTEKVNDVHLRRAIFYGTNRGEMVNTILFGYADVIGGTIPSGMNGYVSPYAKLYDPVLAKEELKKSQYDGREITMLVHELANSELIGQIFQKHMLDIGIKIKLNKLDYNSVIGRMVKGEAEMFSMFAEIIFSSPEPLLLNLFSSSKIPVPNFWHYSNIDIDNRLEWLRLVKDKKMSVRMAADIDKEIMRDVPAIFLYRQKQVIMFSDKFTDLKVNAHNHYMLEALKTAE
ncbi:putative ABC transporter, substrate-binding protein [Desulfonema limicola]|uniref:ABC transporter, substrate-binding protein n=1 Tax=Desulfonema limicola TaxID=45656 RepID=A0A975B4R6_9BACT|nr:ABC transporter substrate-binding protein [Desulfonema limicola]QTA78757.1 putative ABC transporter, substrate-binding protein [Desulfonema limicola]